MIFELPINVAVAYGDGDGCALRHDDDTSAYSAGPSEYTAIYLIALKRRDRERKKLIIIYIKMLSSFAVDCDGKKIYVAVKSGISRGNFHKAHSFIT
jgi:hypothetical protein